LGASGAIFGILVGFAMLFPNLEMMIMFIPVPIKAKYVVIGYVAIELFTGVGRFAGDNMCTLCPPWRGVIRLPVN
jgi:membrane associated rhomboid family serine protease